jgi:hypothetical protein
VEVYGQAVFAAQEKTLPLKNKDLDSQPQTVQKNWNLPTTVVQIEKQPELAALLTANYQQRIAELYNLGVFEITLFLDIADQLIKLAEHYHCAELARWANSLKNQTKLFDIRNITKTLADFDKLIKQLRG